MRRVPIDIGTGDQGIEIHAGDGVDRVDGGQAIRAALGCGAGSHPDI